MTPAPRKVTGAAADYGLAWRQPHKDSWALVNSRGGIVATIQWRQVWPGESWWYGQTAGGEIEMIVTRGKLQVAKDAIFAKAREIQADKHKREEAKGGKQGATRTARPARRVRRADREDE